MHFWGGRGPVVAANSDTLRNVDLAVEQGVRGKAMAASNEAQAMLTSGQQRLVDLWEEHVRDEFLIKNADVTIETMVPDAYVNHIPVMTGGFGREALRSFYSLHFIPKMPPDTGIELVSRTVGSDRLVDEMIFRFTHTIQMDWMLPGIAPTGRHVEVPLVAIVSFRGDKLVHEHIYWDQAGVLVQLGLLDASSLPVAGAETARKALDPSLPSNELMSRLLPDVR
jgi:carboxymethylenebutenolidase